MRRQDTGIPGIALPVDPLDHNGSCSIAEQNGRGPVIPVKQAGEGFRANYQGARIGARRDELVCRCQRKHETRADSRDIKGSAPRDAEAGLHLRRRGRKGVVRRCGCQHDEIDIGRAQPGMGESRLGSLQCELARGFALGGDMTLGNARALANPLVGCLQPCCEFGIGEDARGKIAPDAGDA